MTNAMPYIPEFSGYKERNKWLFENAISFTLFMRKNRTILKEEHRTWDEVEARAKKLVERKPDTRYLIYAVYGIHDTLVATVSVDGTVRHE